MSISLFVTNAENYTEKIEIKESNKKTGTYFDSQCLKIHAATEPDILPSLLSVGNFCGHFVLFVVCERDRL